MSRWQRFRRRQRVRALYNGWRIARLTSVIYKHRRYDVLIIPVTVSKSLLYGTEPEAIAALIGRAAYASAFDAVMLRRGLVVPK